MTTPTTLREKNCRRIDTAATAAEIVEYLKLVPRWELDGGVIICVFNFKNYYQTLAFTNAIAWMIHAQDHHPELTITYNRCVVRYNTHSVNNGGGGITENDFICAAKIDAIFAQMVSPSQQ